MKFVEFLSLEWLFFLGNFCVVLPEGGGQMKEWHLEVQFSPSQNSESHICSIQDSVTGNLERFSTEKQQNKTASQMFRFTPGL